MKLSPTNSNDGTATSNLIKALTILQSLGEAIPVGGGVIKSIAGIGITILELAQSVRENQEECTRIAERAARDILSLHGELNGDLPISEDLRERLGSYLQVLEEVLKTVQELGEGSRTKRFLNADGVQSETKECVGILQDAYQRFILRSTIAADTKLTNILNAVTQLALTSERQSTSSSSLDDPDDPDEIPRIRISSLTFSSEIIRIEKKGFILRVQEGEMRDAIGKREAVMVRRFETAGSARAGQGQGGAGEDEGRKAFEREAEMRRDLLSREFGRMLGIAIAKYGWDRTF
ncbi:hypothetical protein SISSUDRAFT_190310 [Sistotremastrum suecicum HHB10207 ss-3]|uniref:Mixed lineage kinase domain-containing protein n=1 Tax=Sistotremastrum suecicum HHB10207 ss-3 TaxID=1314776 RepID=A0A166ADJ1_9AGAM|nr:hypothetical protein SISSUDRAFT_190310 [Sistotremastrum suecicum HHB10207 ss-3]